MAFVLVFAACILAFRLLAWANRSRGSPARELFDRRLRQGPF